MATFQVAARPEEFSQRSRHILFVEGSSESSIDLTFLAQLLSDTPVRVQRLGPSRHVKAAAEALHPHHPDYYFLVDRDHHSETEVEKSWANFPDPTTHNLLIWRRREFENYFLDPDLLLRSKFIACSRAKLCAKIVSEVRPRAFFDIANLVIISVREQLRQNWIKVFENPSRLKTVSEAKAALVKRPEWNQKKGSDLKLVEAVNLERMFDKVQKTFLGDSSEIQFGSGNWLMQCKAKAVLATVANSPLFDVRGSDGAALRGVKKLDAVVRELARRPLNDQPGDFKALHNIISSRARN